MYVLYAKKQVQAVTYDGLIRLLIQIPLPSYSVEVGMHIQIDYTDKVSECRTCVLEPGYRSNCKFGHVNFCEMTSPWMDCSFNSSLSG
jgi:hypothetical protein